MALEIDTLHRNKRIFNPYKSSSEVIESKYGIWDLTDPSISFSGVVSDIKDFTIVPEYFQMRPDLVAALKMGSHNNMGSLLKFNSISNPFSIKEGQVLAVPELYTVEDMFNAKQINRQRITSGEDNKDNPLQNFRKNQEQKTFKISEGRKKFIENRIKNPPDMILPTNVTQPSERSSVVRNGFMILAPDSGGGGFNSPQDN